MLFGATALVAAFATLLVPDTGKACLPDTVRQAEFLDASESRTTQNDHSGSGYSRKNALNMINDRIITFLNRNKNQ